VSALLTALLLLATPLAAQDTPSRTVSVTTVEPRSFGYFVGDLLTREIDVTVADPLRLEKASQPEPRRLSYWLDLKSVDIEETAERGGMRYRLKLVYQTFYVPISPTPRTLPALTLRFTDGDEAVVAEVPSFSFVMAPLREVKPQMPPEGPEGYLRPDIVPHASSTRDSRIGFGTGLLITFAALVLYAYYAAWWPFGKRPARPFTQTARALRRLQRQPEDGNSFRNGLLDLHRAFDATAGRRLLAEDVPRFLSAHAQFRPFAPEIERFFATSRQAFFGNDLPGAAKAMPLSAIAALGSKLGEAERSAS